MVTDEEMYEGLSPEEIKLMRGEVVEKWGEDELVAVEQRIRDMGKEGWKDVKKRGEEIVQLLADLMSLGPADLRVQQSIELYHRYMCNFYEVDEARYRGLGQMYIEDERFTAYYEKFKEGLAHFVKQGIDIYCDNGMKIPKELDTDI